MDGLPVSVLLLFCRLAAPGPPGARCTPAPPQKRPQAGPVAKAERGPSAGATAIGGNVFHIQADVFQILFVFHFVLQDFAQYMGGKQVFIFYHFQ